MSRTFEFPENALRVCPVCGTGDKGQAILVPIDGTRAENIEQAILVHVECIQLDKLRYWGYYGQ